MKTLTRALVALSLTTGLVQVSLADDRYPDRPIRWVVPNPAGGGTDAVIRTLANAMGLSMGQPMVVDNKPGASTIIGADTVAKSRPDGYTILTGDNATFATNPSLYNKLSYDPARDFVYVGMTARFPLALVARNDFPARTVQEVLAYAKSNPGKINYATPGTGLPHHLAMELLMEQSGVSMTHVPYKGSPPALQGLMTGEVDVMFVDLASGMSFIKDGRVRAFGVASRQRFEGLPEIKTLQELGLNGFEAYAWQGMVVPTGTKADVVTRLNMELKGALANPSVRMKLIGIGVEPAASSPEEFAHYVRTERERWGKLIAAKSIKID